MTTQEKKFSLLAPCSAGVEGLVGDELRELGYDVQVENGRVRFQGGLKDIAQTNLWSRIADRIKIVVGEFEATTFDDLFDRVKALPWEDYIPVNGAFPVAGRSIKSQLHSVPDVQRIVDKAIAERLKEVYRRQGMLSEEGEKFPIEVAIRNDQVLLTLDTTGDGLFKRGYRVRAGYAPLKENLAAALIKLTTWHPDRPFADPMCGSGTLPIEAAMIGQNIAPGFNRDFLCEKWDWMPEEVWEEVRAEADAAADYDRELDITGSDLDERMIWFSGINAREVGLSHAIKFVRRQNIDFPMDKEHGILISNPPYGERLLEVIEARKIYREMGLVFSQLDTWSKYFITSDMAFEEYYGAPATKKRKLYNGPLRADFYQYWAEK